MNLKIIGGQILSGEITPSGSKNSVVALIPATLLFDTPVTLQNVPDITDVSRLTNILTKFGSKINWDKSASTLTIDNSSVSYANLDRGDLGSMKGTSLFWGPMLARFGKVQFDELPGGCVLGARPLEPHYQAFADLGVKVRENECSVSMDATQAHASGIWLTETSPTVTENTIMLATKLPGTTKIVNAATEPHTQDLCNFLVSAGAKITGIGSSVLTIEGGRSLTSTTYSVLSDHCEIGTFLALGAITGGKVTVHNAIPQHFVAINREFAKFGIHITYKGDSATVEANQKPSIAKTKSAMIVRAQPWPALPIDMLPLFIPLALAAPSGLTLFHNWMYEAGLFWTSELTKFGANVIMCDPHRIIVSSGNKLRGDAINAPYIIRAVISLAMTAMIAEGETTISNADSLYRGHPNFAVNLAKLGAKITEVS